MHASEKSGAQNATRAWIATVLRHTGWSQNRLAIEAHVSPATIHRAMNDDRFVTTTATLAKIAKAAGIPAPFAPPPGPPATSGFREPEAVYITTDPAGLARPLAATEARWELKSRAIELAGYLPGDELRVDSAALPRPGAVVCVQIYNLEQGTAETVFRVYEPPYVTTRTMDPAISTKPLLVDDERIKIWGMVVEMTRRTRTPEASSA